MNRPRRTRPTLLCAAAFSVAAAPALAANPQFPTVRVDPQRVEMTAFYSGAELRIDGMASPGSKVIVVLRGSDMVGHFNRKGRVGPIWINVGKLDISGVPSLFLRFSPEPVERLLAPGEIERYQLSEAAIKRQMIVAPARLDHEDIRSGYLALKIEQGVYSAVSGTVKMGEPAGEGTPYSLSFHWPRRASPASYEVRVYECRGGAIAGASTVPLTVVRAGFPATMAYLAADRPALCGILAVLAAVLAGFGIDFIASRLPKKRAVPAEVKPAARSARGGAH